MTTPELESLIREALRMQALQTPEERAAALREASIDFAFGNLTCTGRRPHLTREIVAQQYDKLYPKEPS
jgi:hypothetical protein